MFQLLVWLDRLLRMIDGRRVVAYQVIVVDDAFMIQDQRIVETCLLIIVHRVQVVRSLGQRDDAVA